MDANPTRAEPGWPPVVVGGAYHTGVILMRNLARRGLRVCSFDSNRAQPGFQTVYGRTYLCPNPDLDPMGWLSFMVDLSGRIGGKPVLISSADQFVLAMAEHAPTLAKHYLFCHSTVALQARLTTKRELYATAGANGFPVPNTRVVDSVEDLLDFAKSARYPCLLKPLRNYDWQSVPPGHPLFVQKVIRAYSIEELIKAYRVVAAINPQMVAQEVIEGPDTAKLVYLSCYRNDGERIGACLMREIRAFPMHYGVPTVVEPATDPEADRLCDQFLRRIGYRGLGEIELKRDSRDGRLRMIEVNPRATGVGCAAPHAGVDLGWLHYLDLIGQAVTPVEPVPSDFRHIMVASDAAAIRAYMRRGELTWGGLLRSYRPPVALYDIDPRDWRVTLSACVSIIKTIIGPWYRRVVPRKLKPIA